MTTAYAIEQLMQKASYGLDNVKVVIHILCFAPARGRERRERNDGGQIDMLELSRAAKPVSMLDRKSTIIDYSSRLCAPGPIACLDCCIWGSQISQITPEMTMRWAR